MHSKQCRFYDEASGNFAIALQRIPGSLEMKYEC